MNNNTERIGRYLQNEMNANERDAFEKQLAEDKDLQQDLSVQKQILNAVERAGLKSSFAKAIQTKYISRLLVRWGIVTIVVASLAYYAYKSNLLSHANVGSETSISTPGTERFLIDNSVDTIIETDEGVVFGIPANAFDSKNKVIRLEIKTAISADKIMLQGLSTTSNGSLLQTAGMFYLNAYDKNKPVSLVKKIEVSVPTDKVNPAMQLFNGVQDSSGRINWVSPKPIEKKLRTYDVTSLDFYPPNYIPALKALGKDHANKKYTDSLYYSFSGYPYYYSQSLGGRIFYTKCSSCHILGRDFTGPNLQGVVERWGGDIKALKTWILNWNKAVKVGYPRAIEVQNFSSSSMQVFQGMLSDAELDALIKWVNEWTQSAKPNSIAVVSENEHPKIDVPDTTNKEFIHELDMEMYGQEIDPSRVRAIWDEKFNNTIIATKEFEERLRYMHTICDPLFRFYLENLDKPMYEIDQLVADKIGSFGTGPFIYQVQHKFLDFAARKDGGVMLKDGMQQKLSEYFEKKFKAYRDASVRTWAKHEHELNRLAAIADGKKREHDTKEFLRKDKNLQEEFSANLNDAYQQIGIKKTYNDTIVPLPPPTNFYNIQIDTLGWKNIDMYVMEATEARESMTYKDPETGKTATITYKEASMSIEDQQQYDRVLVYLLPNGLSSFQRVDQTGNIFKEKLNMLFKYDAIAIGFKGEQAYYYKQTNLQPKQHSFRLSAITAKELRRHLKTVSTEKSAEMMNEYEYKLFEQQEIRREVQLRKDLEFRNQVVRAIWNCGEEGFPIADPDSKRNISDTIIRQY